MDDRGAGAGRGGVDWKLLTWSSSMMPPDAYPMLVVFMDRRGEIHITGASWFLKQLTSITARIIGDSVREYLTGLVRPRG